MILRSKSKLLVLASIAILSFLLVFFSLSKSQKQTSPSFPKSGKLVVGMRFPPLEKICDYPVAVFWRRNLMDAKGNIDVAILEKASSCGTKVVLRLSGFTRDIVNDSGKGLSLKKFEERIKDFVGSIEPFIQNGTVMAHLTIDEPDDCKDWGGVCPQQEELEEASRISKKYWPSLPTMIHTSPGFANRYDWKDTDVINFQYALHKGDVKTFINDSVKVLQSGKGKHISWSIQAAQGGCPEFGKCSMTPSQVLEIATAMCQTKSGWFISFSSYRDDLMTPAMTDVLRTITQTCNK